MKKSVFSVLLAFFVVQANPQSLTVQDLLKYDTMEIPGITRELARKQFRLIRKVNDGIADTRSITYFWTVHFNPKTRDAREWFTVSMYDGKKSKLTYETEVKTNYVSFVASLSRSGFRFIENIQHENQNGISSYYGNGEYTVIVHPRIDRWTIYFRKSN